MHNLDVFTFYVKYLSNVIPLDQLRVCPLDLNPFSPHYCLDCPQVAISTMYKKLYGTILVVLLTFFVSVFCLREATPIFLA